jgi:formylaminopyrimidine deformylase / aminopyrimidine aminohydrolase
LLHDFRAATERDVIEILEEDFGPLWNRVVRHPFVIAAADGSLHRDAADRWLVEDHHFIMSFRRFLGGLVLACQDRVSADVLSQGFTALQFELTLFRTTATKEGVDLDRQPSPSTVSWSAYLLNSLHDGYTTAIAVLYAAERVYLEAWQSVRAWADRGSRYWPFIDNWSSDAFGDWVDAIGILVDRTTPESGGQVIRRAFERVLRYELQYMDGLFVGDTW